MSSKTQLFLDSPRWRGIPCPMSDKLLKGDTREVALELSETWGEPGFCQPARP